MIVHDPITLTTPDAPVVFAELLGISISICAPDTMTEAEITRYANADGPRAHTGEWIVVNKSKLGLGSSTPNPCNQVAGRKHWFLLAAGMEAMWR